MPKYIVKADINIEADTWLQAARTFSELARAVYMETDIPHFEGTLSIMPEDGADSPHAGLRSVQGVIAYGGQ